MKKLLAQATAAAYTEGYSAKVIEDSRFMFEKLIHYHLASLVVLANQGIVPRPRTRRLVGALLTVLERGYDALAIDPSLEDLQPNVEQAVVSLVGPDDAGDFGIARARAEFGHVAAHLSLREETLDTLGAQLKVNQELLALAERHIESLVPYYTQHMRAEPITFGYYFSAVSEAFLQHALRMRDAYARFQRSPAGVGHIVPTPLRLDRRQIADLMGLGEPMHHSLYAYLNSDAYVDALGAASLTAASASRLCFDFWWWSSNEFKTIRFSDEWCGGSFIMPHKRNPSWLKALRFSSMSVKARHNEAQELWMHGSPMLLVGSLPIPAIAHDGLASLRHCCELLCGALPTLTIDTAHARSVAEQDFVQSSQLVSMIVALQQASWRQAEHVIGKLVGETAAAGRPASDMKFERLIEIGRDMLGRTLELDPKEFAAALDVDNIVASRGDCGPAPAAVLKVVKVQKQSVAELSGWVDSEQRRLAGCWERVRTLAKQI